MKLTDNIAKGLMQFFNTSKDVLGSEVRYKVERDTVSLAIQERKYVPATDPNYPKPVACFKITSLDNVRIEMEGVADITYASGEGQYYYNPTTHVRSDVSTTPLVGYTYHDVLPEGAENVVDVYVKNKLVITTEDGVLSYDIEDVVSGYYVQDVVTEP